MARNAFIKGCIEVEKSAAIIYKKLIKKFPEKKESWKSLLEDELEHISFLKDVKSLGLVDEMQKMGEPPSKPIINKTLELADNLTKTITKDSVTFKKVLRMTLKLEESMVETYTNKVIANLISCEDKSTYKKILADEKKHINKIKKMIEIK